MPRSHKRLNHATSRFASQSAHTFHRGISAVSIPVRQLLNVGEAVL